MDFEAIYSDLHFFTINSAIYAKILFIVFTCFALYKATNVIFRIAMRYITAKHWVFTSIICAIQTPLRVFFVLLGFVIVIQELSVKFGFAKIKSLLEFEILTFVFCIAWASISFIGNIKKHILESSNDYEDRTLILAVSQIVTILIIITVILISLHILNVNIAGILALGGVGGIMVGFAAKDLLANFFGALMIYIDKPFQVGDWICSPEKEIEGVVENIGWRQVKIIRFDTRPIYVPNAIFSNIVIENPSRMTHRRFYETITIRYQDLCLVEDIIHDIRYMLSIHPSIEKEKDIIVNLLNFEEYIKIFIWCYVKEQTLAKFSPIKQEILLECGKIIEKYNAEMTVPILKNLK